MALNAAQQWWVRADGVETNGGGYDATVSGAGVNYSDQAAPQLSITDLTSTASTTVTSVLATFTSAMVGNILRLASGTGTTVGYYMITAYVSASQVTLDRASGTYTAGVAKVGGAHASLVNYSNGGSGLASPAIASPLAPGHQVNIRGAGTDTPASSDYNYAAGYWTFPAGNATVGAIRWLGYNGRPRFTIDGLLFYNPLYHRFENLFGFFEASPTYTSFGFIGADTAAPNVCTNVRVDANGLDATLLRCSGIISCELLNSGGGAAGTVAAVRLLGYPGGSCRGNWIHGVRGDGINTDETDGVVTATRNLITGCGRYGLHRAGGASLLGGGIFNNTIHGNGGDGIRLETTTDIASVGIAENLITSNGGYGVNAVVNTAFLNNSLIHLLQNNAMRSNTSGTYNNLTAPASDVALTGDPYTNAAGNDFSLNNTAGAGAACRAASGLGVFPGGLTTGYLDIGAVQHADPAGGGGLTQRQTLVRNIGTY